MKNNLYTALLEAQKSIDSVAKDSKNTFANYEYVSAETMVKECRTALLKNSIMVWRKSWSYSREAHETYRVESAFCVMHSESGEMIESVVSFPGLLRKGITADKAVACALTSSLSYFLRDLLLLPKFSAAENMDARNDVDEQSSTYTYKKVRAPSGYSGAYQSQLKNDINAKLNFTGVET